MHEPITTLFSYQSTEAERVVQEYEPNDDEIMVSFSDLQFNLEEDNVPDKMIMSGKKFKILNNKINSLIQIQKDNVGRNFITGVKMSFDYKIQKLRDVAKERHDVFVEQVKNMKEFLDLKVVELKSEMAKKVEKVEKNYVVLYTKLDVIADAITKLVNFNTDYSTKLEKKSEKDS
ncbi:unnamed protein product [Lactuca virosa]|uniref:Uncharacterized protein n=1 Tax=Lactuca virosa TaxID=75947 RepID=A0AAU9PVQ2_9ASTR|nr:unnamed protein product [Lactuca virosa]